jgi:hypothetical protein
VDAQVMGVTSVTQLAENAKLVNHFVTMGSQEQENLMARVSEPAGDGRYERFKSTSDFEGPHHLKQHGFA